MRPVPAAEADPRDNPSPYGVLAFFAWNHDWNNFHYPDQNTVDRDIALMKKAGVGFVRMDILWADVEPEQGRFEFARYDGIINALRKAGIGILAVLEYNPSWRPGPWNQPPLPDDYEKYVRAVVGHFKDRVRYWEVWNEVDQKIYWDVQDELTTYGALLKRITPVIKDVDPTAKVAMSGLSKEWAIGLRRIYQKAGKDSFDIVNIHPFTDPLMPNPEKVLQGYIVAVKKVMKEFGDEDKPIWLTEIGCPGVKKPNKTNTWWVGHSPTEAQQAAWVKTVYETTLAIPGVEKVFWAFWRDTNHFKDGVATFGLVRDNAQPKPAFSAYQEITSKNQLEPNR